MSSRLFVMMRNFLMVAMLIVPISAYSWTFDFNFDNETVGLKTNNFDDAAGYSIVNNDESYSGNNSIRLSIDGGTEGFGYFGGRKFFPINVGEGEEIWIRIRVKVPSSFDYTTNFALKFLRVLVESGDRTKLRGHVDIYVNNDGSMKYQNEQYTTEKLILKDQVGTFVVGETVTGQNSGAKAKIVAIKTSGLVYEYIGATQFVRWEKLNAQSSGASAILNRSASNSVTNFGASGTFAKDVWKTFIYRIKFSATNPLVQFYASVGSSFELMFEDTTDFTLQNSTDVATTFLLFTYWNGSAPKTQFMYVDDLWLSTDPPPEIGKRIKKVAQDPVL